MADMIKEFESFMKHRRYWKKWNENRSSEDQQSFLAMHPPADYIIAAFIWEDTPEGPAYWDRADNKWREHRSMLIEQQKKTTENRWYEPLKAMIQDRLRDWRYEDLDFFFEEYEIDDAEADVIYNLLGTIIIDDHCFPGMDNFDYGGNDGK